jgi:hypothetical protein
MKIVEHFKDAGAAVLGAGGYAIAAAVLTFLILWAAPCFATPSISSVGTNTGTSQTTRALTVTCGAGSLLTIEVAVRNATFTAPTGVGVSDTHSNTYTVITSFNASTDSVTAVIYSVLTNALSAAAVTAAWTGTTTNSRVLGQCTTGLTSTPLDVTGTWNSATGTGPGTNGNLTTGTLAQASELIISVDDEVSANAAWTADTGHGFTQLTNLTFGGRTAVDTQVVASTASVTSNPTLATSQLYDVNVFTFKASGGGVTATCGRGMLMGVGC